MGTVTWSDPSKDENLDTKPKYNTVNTQLETTPTLSQTYAHDSVADKAAFAARLGMLDTYRGVKQLFNIQEDEMAEDMAKLNEYIANPEYGGTILAAYTGGLFGDPVGWLIPGMKAKNLWSATKAGLMVGALSSPIGYVDRAEGQTRLSNMAIGTAGGGVLSPAMFKFTNSLLPALKKGYSNFGVSIDTGKVADDLGIISKAASTVGANIGAPIYGGMKTVGTKIKKHPIGQGFGKYFIDNFGLPKEYVHAKMNRRQAENLWASKFDTIIAKYNELDLAENKLLYKLLTGEDIKMPGHLKDLTSEGRKLVDDLGQELVDIKILKKEVYEANKGKYLYRSYEKHQEPFVKRNMKAEKQIRVFGSEFMRRGETKVISKELKKGHIKDGWRVVSEDADARTVKVNRDWSKADREKMGEILSAGFAMAKTGNLMTNDIASFKFYDDISKMVIDGNKVARNVKPKDLEDVDSWVQMPTSNIKGTDVKEFGALSGKYVPKEIHHDLNVANQYKRWNRGDGQFGGLTKYHHKALQFWKRGKTTLNPTVHTNNVGSNFLLYDFLDGDWKKLRSAGGDFLKAKAKGEKSEDFKLAESLGVFDADMMSRELTDYETSIFKKYMSMKKKDDVQFSSMLQRGWNRVKEFAKRTPMDTLYQVEDQVFRLGAFKTKLAEGASPDEAARFARRSMLDYDISARGIRLLRESALPFIAYTYRVAPILGETAIKRPWKLAKWAAILQGANMVGQDISPGDYEKERRYQKELNMGYDLSSLGMPGVSNTLIKVPRKDKSQYLDATRFIPGGDILDIDSTGIHLPMVPAPLQPSFGAIGSLTKIATGFDTFSVSMVPGIGSDIPSYQAGERMNIVEKEFVPMYHQYTKLGNAIRAGGTPHPTKDDSTWQEAALNLVPGLKLKTYDKVQMKKFKMRVGMKYKNRMESLAKLLNKDFYDYKGGRISKEEYERSSKRIRASLKKLQAEARKALRKAK